MEVKFYVIELTRFSLQCADIMFVTNHFCCHVVTISLVAVEGRLTCVSAKHLLLCCVVGDRTFRINTVALFQRPDINGTQPLACACVTY
jgi:hypothetical protein